MNVAGFASMAIGVVVYLLLLDPVSFASAPLFAFTTATLPSVLATVVVYVLLARLQPKVFGRTALPLDADKVH